MHSTNTTLKRTMVPYITNNVPHITTQHGYERNHSTDTAVPWFATGFNQKQPPARITTVSLDLYGYHSMVGRSGHKSQKYA